MFHTVARSLSSEKPAAVPPNLKREIAGQITTFAVALILGGTLIGTHLAGQHI